MKRRIQLALMGCVLSVGTFLYLTLHYYPLKFGLSSGQSICNLNAKFDCDAVSASSFSAVFGIPLAAWGAVFYSVLFLMILMSWLEWSDHPERLRRWTLLLAGLGLTASLTMAGISFAFMSSYCLFCIATYVLSAVIFVSLLKILRAPFWSNLFADIPHLWGESRGILICLAAIPVLAFFTHRIFMQNLGDAQVSRLVQGSVRDWESASPVTFVAKPSLVMGAPLDKANLTLTEFADFRCGHCKNASYTLHAFVKSHPDVRFEFYSFPLDGACNEKIQQANGLSCRLAAAVYCGEKDGKGWPVHDLLFAKQNEIINFATSAELDNFLAKEIGGTDLNWQSLQLCMNQQETADALKAQSKQGALVNVMGTPTLFANGKMLPRGGMLPVLQAVHEKVRTSKN